MFPLEKIRLDERARITPTRVLRNQGRADLGSLGKRSIRTKKEVAHAPVQGKMAMESKSNRLQEQ